ncbi:hypothetical protein BN8_01149 [Fibrisoma limi BUZ 3]|uniref:Uncharacterized protein n=1 Tax=Fibrisoma limi BUZ 3 TaxID=1185876 RepID=I2GE50_9BACT|nr:hypothetical protein BN8_01149 [Fibrisoma limi BUZ 3]
MQEGKIGVSVGGLYNRHKKALQTSTSGGRSFVYLLSVVFTTYASLL